MKGVSFFVALSVLCNDNHVSLTLAKSTWGMVIHDITDAEIGDDHVSVVSCERTYVLTVLIAFN